MTTGDHYNLSFGGHKLSTEILHQISLPDSWAKIGMYVAAESKYTVVI